MTEEQLEIIISVLGYLVLITALISMQVKKMQYLVIFQCVSNLCVVAQYLLRGEFSAMGICTLGATLTLVIFFYDIKEKQVPKPIILSFVLAGIALTVAVVIMNGTFDPKGDIVPLVAWVVFNVAMMQSKSWIARIFMASNSALWLLHNVINYDLSLIITYTILFVTAVIGMVRLDRAEWGAFLKGMGNKNKNNAEN